MGKRTLSQRRGKGTSNFRSPPLKKIEICYPKVYIEDQWQRQDSIISGPRGRLVIKYLHRYDNSKWFYNYCAEGYSNNLGLNPLQLNKILKLSEVEEGTTVCNIEFKHKDGGKLCRAPGVFATIVGKTQDYSILKVYKRFLKVSNLSRCTIGAIGQGDMRIKPWLKAGNKKIGLKNRARPFFKVRGFCKNPVDHPHGGQSRRPHKSKSRSQHRPPGSKCGAIKSRRTGRKQKK